MAAKQIKATAINNTRAINGLRAAPPGGDSSGDNLFSFSASVTQEEKKKK
jgi:hypothetical protein